MSDPREELTKALLVAMYGEPANVGPTRLLWKRTEQYVEAICDPAIRDLVLAAMGDKR
jgi:hypothetical protein